MSPVWKLGVRWRAIEPFTKDVLLACVLGIAVVLEALLSESAEGHELFLAVAGVLCVVPPLVLRRRAPIAGAVIFVVVILGSDLVGPSVADALGIPFLAVLGVLYSVARYLEGRALWTGLALLTTGLVAALAFSADNVGDVVFAAVLALLPVLAGRAVRSRVLLQRELRVKALRLEAEREQRALRAVDDERGRIAEELQSVVANGLSAMVVQAGAVPRVLSGGDPAAAGQAFLVIEETGRDALAEMRRLLGVLRHEDEAPSLVPQPGLGRLDPLVQRLRAAGLDVQLSVEGERRELPSGVDLTAHRVVQHALDAAREAGASRASATIRYRPREIEFQIRDDRPAGGRAEVPAELRERTRLYGGRVHADTAGGKGFQLLAWLPVEDLAVR